MSNPFAPNTDVQAVSDEADAYSMGLTEPDDGSPSELVIAVEREGSSVALFFEKAEAEQFLGRLIEQMREMGWLS